MMERFRCLLNSVLTVHAHQIRSGFMVLFGFINTNILQYFVQDLSIIDTLIPYKHGNGSVPVCVFVTDRT